MHVPVQTRELPLPALEKPAVQVHPVAPALLVLPAGQAVQVADPAVALYVLASQTVTCARGGGREGGAGRDGAGEDGGNARTEADRGGEEWRGEERKETWPG